MATFLIKRKTYQQFMNKPSTHDDEEFIVYLDGVHCGYFDSFKAAMMFICLRKSVAFPKGMSFTINFEG